MATRSHPHVLPDMGSPIDAMLGTGGLPVRNRVCRAAQQAESPTPALCVVLMDARPPFGVERLCACLSRARRPPGVPRPRQSNEYSQSTPMRSTLLRAIVSHRPTIMIPIHSIVLPCLRTRLRTHLLALVRALAALSGAEPDVLLHVRAAAVRVDHSSSLCCLSVPLRPERELPVLRCTCPQRYIPAAASQALRPCPEPLLPRAICAVSRLC